MMRLLAVLFALLPLPAFALSCLPHGVTDAYIAAAEATEGYVPVVGELSFDAGLVPKMDLSNQQYTPGDTYIPAQFKGRALDVRGVDRLFATDVVLHVQCAGPWCPNPQPGEVLAFLRRTPQSFVLNTNACGGFLFVQPTEPQVRQLEDCLSGRSCVPAAFR